MSEHPVEQPIRYIQVNHLPGWGPDGDGTCFMVGDDGVTRIEACTKSGMHANIPYLRVWADDRCVAEFCQHQIVGVYFEPPAPAEPAPISSTQREIDRCKANAIQNIVNGKCTTCEMIAAECDCIPF